MPDLTIQYFWECESANAWSHMVIGSRDDAYEVTYRETPEGPYTHGYQCTCPHFRIRLRASGDHCKHIEQAKLEHCLWMQIVDGGEPDRDDDDQPICPRCGGPVTSRAHGV